MQRTQLTARNDFQFSLRDDIEDLSCLSNSFLEQALRKIFLAFIENPFQSLKGLVLDDSDCHIIVLEIDIFINLIVYNNLIFLISKMHEHTLIVSAFSLAQEILTVLHSSE